MLCWIKHIQYILKYHVKAQVNLPLWNQKTLVTTLFEDASMNQEILYKKVWTQRLRKILFNYLKMLCVCVLSLSFFLILIFSCYYENLLFYFSYGICRAEINLQKSYATVACVHDLICNIVIDILFCLNHIVWSIKLDKTL